MQGALLRRGCRPPVRLGDNDAVAASVGMVRNVVESNERTSDFFGDGDRISVSLSYPGASML
jgi:hypothetical protein